VAVMPGALTPTEVVQAWNAGADFVKVFPAGAVGGPSYLKSLKAPLPQIELVPTGGVNLKTAADFIKAGAAALGVGADLVDVKAIRDGQAAIITERAKKFVEIVRQARED
jgi:2-dehydro-3-deoxyphosphogluconate aldolase / (4S)-4-hydroxy-2-oxoglutarate aldolase